MLAKKTFKNQITLPKKIADQFPGVDYFEVEIEGSRIVLKPANVGRADQVREKLKALGISESDVNDAITWARSAPRK